MPANIVERLEISEIKTTTIEVIKTFRNKYIVKDYNQ
jgi:hypothetical protein